MELTTVLWIVGVLLAALGGLTGIVWAIVWGAITRHRTTSIDIYHKLESDRKECRDKFDEMTKLLAEERKDRQEKHDIAMHRVFNEIDKVKDKQADLDVTSAGFGTVYVTRKEFHEQQRRG